MKDPLYRLRFGKNLPINESQGGRGDLSTHQSSGKFPRIGSGPMSQAAFLLLANFCQF
jgi:hypothetical protein